MSYNFPDAPSNGTVFTPSGGPTWEFGDGAWRQAIPLAPPVAGATTLDVRMYGATGDGTTDDRAAIQTALDAAEGRMLYFPYGTYLVTDALHLPDNITIYGDGYGSMITCPDEGWSLSDTGRYGILNMKDVNNLRITNLHIRGTKVAAGINDTPKLIMFDTVVGLTIDHCWLENTAYEGIWSHAHGGNFGANNRIIIAHNHCYDIGYGTLPFTGLSAIQPNARDCTIIGNEIYHCGVGIGPSGWNVTVTGNIIRDFTLCGISSGDSFEYGTYTITGNTIEFNGHASANRVGIFLLGSSYPEYHPRMINCVGNTIYFTGVEGSTGSMGVYVHPLVRNTFIANNTIEFETDGVGIQVFGHDDGNYCVLRGNTIKVYNEGVGPVTAFSARPQGASAILTLHSMGNTVYGLTRAKNSYAYDYNGTVSGTLLATSCGDIMSEGRYRIGSINYQAGELDNVPIFMTSDLARQSSYASITKTEALSFADPLVHYVVGGIVNLGGALASVNNRRSRLRLNAEGGVATDDLDTINGLLDGDVLIVSPNSDSQTIIAKDGTGNLRLAGDFTMDSITDRLMLISDGTLLYELSRSDNGA